MGEFESLRDDLYETLRHLHTPDMVPSPLLQRVMGLPDGASVELRSRVVKAIEGFEPPPDTPRDADAWRIYHILHYCFVLGLTQEEAAERIDLSARHLRRLQGDAIHALACHFWERRERRTGPTSAGVLGGEVQPEWHSQIEQDLASLDRQPAPQMSDVQEVLLTVADLTRELAASHGLTVDVAELPHAQQAAVNPSALRQMIITAVGHLIQRSTTGCITMRARRGQRYVEIDVRGQSATAADSPKLNLLRQLASSQGCTVAMTGAEQEGVTIRLTLPAPGEIPVLVIDDNADLLHFYRRCVRGTRYHVVAADPVADVMEQVTALSPAMIVLDLMLPTVDGWKVLRQLRRCESTQSIPIIVCTVMREEELILSLGATLYLPKPVQYREFIQALDQAFLSTPASAPAEAGRS